MDPSPPSPAHTPAPLPPPLPPRLPQIICPSDDEVCQLHGEQVEDLAAFKRRHLESPAWLQFCQYYEVQQAQPPPEAEPA